MPAPAFFTVDVEDWTSDFPDLRYGGSRVERPLTRLLDLLDAHQAKATLFFLVGPAEEHPELMRRAVRAGHHIGLHGRDHRLVYNQTPEGFGEAIRDGRKRLEDIAGVQVTTYRAPCWSITRKSLWAVDCLQAAGFEVDSSIFPTRNHVYGIPDAPRTPYYLRETLVEIPPSVAEVGPVKVPFGGGIYLRGLPMAATLWLAERQRQQHRPLVVYVHPWELDLEQPRDLPYRSPLARAIHYFGLRHVESRLDRLLRELGPFEALPQTAAAAGALVTDAGVPSFLSTQPAPVF